VLLKDPQATGNPRVVEAAAGWVQIVSSAVIGARCSYFGCFLKCNSCNWFFRARDSCHKLPWAAQGSPSCSKILRRFSSFRLQQARVYYVMFAPNFTGSHKLSRAAALNSCSFLLVARLSQTLAGLLGFPRLSCRLVQFLSLLLLILGTMCIFTVSFELAMLRLLVSIARLLVSVGWA